MTRRRLIVVCAAVAALVAQSGSAESAPRARTPHFRPPSMPMYRGRMLRVPHSSPRASRPPRAAPPQGRPAPQQRQGVPPSRAQPPRAQAQRGPAPPARFAGNFHPPERDQAGRPLQSRPILDVTRKTDLVHQTIADAGFGRTAQGLTASAAERDGQFHWHDANGTRFGYWHDAARNRDWFGFYEGRSYFWTTYYHDHFWWREPVSGRYLVFWRDHWWWRSPQGVPYVYIDEQYYQWLPSQNGVALVPAEVVPARAEGGGEASIVSSQPEFNYSADGSRMVQVEGEKLSAYLYVTSPEQRDGTKPLKYLGDGVTAVSFTDATKGDPLKIVLTVQNPDGSTRTVVLDANGEPVSSAAPVPAAAPISYGTPGTPGYDAPESDLPPVDAPFLDGQ